MSSMYLHWSDDATLKYFENVIDLLGVDWAPRFLLHVFISRYFEVKTSVNKKGVQISRLRFGN